MVINESMVINNSFAYYLKMGKVNLDALIPREDFEVSDEGSQDTTSQIDRLPLSQLEIGNNFFYPALRKPDFQRETNEWDTNKVIGLISSFVNGDLIPAIILWRTKGSYTFVIDGAHRLSALIAWVNDDYGDGVISRRFFDEIPPEQRKIADKTKKLVDSKIGSYISYKKILQEEKGIEPELRKRARELGVNTLQLQWVKGDDKKAEDSFFTINQKQVSINPTELGLIKCRNKPSGIAARAIRNSGTGHKYWSKFPQEKKDEIEKTAKEINSLIYIPRPLTRPIKSLELPIAGEYDKFYASSLVSNFVNIVNESVGKEKKYLFSWNEIPGNDNDRFIEFLKKRFNIGCIDSKIEKIDNGRTIRISSENNSVCLKLNNKNNKVNLIIDDNDADEFIAKTENSRLNLYEKTIPDDIDGTITLEYLKTCKKIALRINSTDTSSLGLHPAIYLYSKDGNYKVVSFYAMIDLILNFNSDDTLLNNFLTNRKQFEELLYKYDYLIEQIVRKYRVGNKSYPYVKEFYVEVINKLSDGILKEKVMEEILKGTKFNYLKMDTLIKAPEEVTKEFSVNAKSAVVIRECIEKAIECKICHGLIDSKSITIDHKIRMREGGLGTEENGQIAHPYCNSVVKH